MHKTQIIMFNKVNVLILFVLSLIITSCIKDLDFDQAENFAISPVVVSSFIFIEEPANRFVDNGIEITTIRDTIKNIEILSDQFVADNLIKAEFLFETTNSVNRAFQVQVEFFNDAFELQEISSFTVLQSPLNEEIISESTKTFEGNSLEALKATSQIVITLTLLPSSDGSILNENSIGQLRLRSKATFYFDIDSSS